MTERLGEGTNYVVTLDESRIVARVHRRRDLDTSAGAEEAERMASTIRAHSQRGRSLLFDLREAPTTFGPRTEDALAAMLRNCEAHGMVVAMLAHDGLQLLQARRLLASTSPRHGRAFDTLEAAEAHLAGPLA